MSSVGFDWIFYVIVAPWPIIALWLAFKPDPPLRPEERNARTIDTGRRR